MVAKNKPAASKDKSDNKTKSKGRKDKGDSSGGSPKAEITVILKDEQATKILKNAKVITKYELARQTGVKISAANAFLNRAVQKNLVKIVGGNSGHRVYQSATTASSSPPPKTESTPTVSDAVEPSLTTQSAPPQ